jgi:hypothetical protein
MNKTQSPIQGKIPVRIDARTVVYVNPGTDIEALKKKMDDHKTFELSGWYDEDARSRHRERKGTL